MAAKALVLDANILIRAVLGQRVRRLIEQHAGSVSFFAPESAFEEAEEHLPLLAIRRNGDPAKLLAVLRCLSAVVEVLGRDVYAPFEPQARERLGTRDPEDWPVLASALAIGCPIWTEDSDFFGCGVPTWTSERVEIFLRGSEA